MRTLNHIYLLLTVILSITPQESFAKHQTYTSRNTMLFRPFCSYAYHDILAQKHELQNNTQQLHAMSLTVTPEYMQSFGCKCNGTKSLGAYPFWSETNEMTIGNNSGQADIDAWQFGLGNVIVDENGIAGKIRLNPKIQQAGADIALHYAHRKNEPSFYFKIHAPIVSLMVSPNLTEHPAAQPDDVFMLTQTTAAPSATIEYANAQYMTPSRRYLSMSQSFQGGVAQCNTIHGSAEKQMQLGYGRISSHHETIVRLADVTAAVGYNFYVNQDHLFGAGLVLTTPTGNTPKAFAMLEPIVGRAGAWGVGGEITGHATLWKADKNNHAVYLNMQTQLLHLIANRTPNHRSFDLKLNGKGSKYLLVQHYPADFSVTIPYTQDRTPHRITPAINITTIPVISKIAFEGVLAAELKYLYKNWNFGLSGEVFGRTQEKLQLDINSIVAEKVEILNNYAVIGRQIGNYYINQTSAPTGSQIFIANLVEPLATINKSQDPIQLVGNVPTIALPTTLPDGIGDARLAENRIPANPSDALDICGAQVPSVVTGKIYLSAGYTWNDKAFVPSLTLFGGVEWVNNNSLPQMYSIGLSGNIQF